MIFYSTVDVFTVQRPLLFDNGLYLSLALVIIFIIQNIMDYVYLNCFSHDCRFVGLMTEGSLKDKIEKATVLKLATDVRY